MLFKALRNVKGVLITTHRHADVDAYCSVYALSKVLAIKGIDSIAYFPNSINEQAKRIARELVLDNIASRYEDKDAIIILDTNNPALLADIKDHVINSRAKVIIIDHHPLLDDKFNAIRFIDTTASSTCEIICKICIRSRIKINNNIAKALMLGILADSQHLTLADKQTIACINYLTRYADINAARSLLSKDRSYPERLARLKAAKRMELYKVDDIIIAYSKVGSYHASAAKALIDLGADLAIVVNEDDIYKVSMRASNRFYSLTNIHLGKDIANKISSKGGGHATAASFANDKFDINSILAIVKDRLGKHVSDVK